MSLPVGRLAPAHAAKAARLAAASLALSAAGVAVATLLACTTVATTAWGDDAAVAVAGSAAAADDAGRDADAARATGADADAGAAGKLAPHAAATRAAEEPLPYEAPASAPAGQAAGLLTAAKPPQGSDRRAGAPASGSAGAAIVQRMLARTADADPTDARRLSLVEAVKAAVANNPGILAQAQLPNRDAWGPMAASAAFDPHVRANGTASSLTAPSGSALTSGRTTFEEDAVRGGASLSKLLRSGATVELAWSTQYIDTNSVFYVINPRYDNRLMLSMRQPLLRDFLAKSSNTAVLVARSQAAESLAAFEASLSRFVAEVADVYWGYEEAAANLEVSRRSHALATQLVREAEARVQVGSLAPVAVKEAQADAAAREEKVLAAENELKLAAHELQHKVMLPGSEGAALPILPIEEHVVTPVDLDRGAAMQVAAEARAEIRGATQALDRRRLEVSLARNLRLPSLDVVGHYGLLGLAGKPTYDSGGLLKPSPYLGGFGDSWSDLASNDFNDYGVGLEFEMPLGNASARARLAQSQSDVVRASRELEQVVSRVALEVDRALADVESAAKRVTASRAARELAEENMRNQARRFELGAVTTKDVLDFQEKLAEAMAAEVQAITDHAMAVTRLRVADGTLLVRFGVEVQSPDAPGKPWWYLF